MATKVHAPREWPVDPETGEPMVIVTAFASEHVGSGSGLPDYAGLDIGPVGASAPCRNDPEAVQAMQAQLLRQAQFVIGSNRRAIQWAMDPTLRVMSPDELEGQPHEQRAADVEAPPPQADPRPKEEQAVDPEETKST